MTAYPELKPCETCLTPMRQSRKKPSDYPFKTLCANSATQCVTCAQREKRAATPAQPKPNPIPKQITVQEVTLRGLSRFLQQRNQRLNAGSVAK